MSRFQVSLYLKSLVLLKNSSTKYEAEDNQDNENEEDRLSYGNSSCCYSSKTKYCGYYRNNKKRDCPF